MKESEENASDRVHVLLVEDSEADELLMRAALKLDGLNCDFLVSEDGEKAIELIDRLDHGTEDRRPNVVLLDLNLPKKSGVKVLEFIRQSRKFADIPVIVVSSSDSPRDQAQVSRLGATRYFQKPLDLMEFMKLGPVVRETLCSWAPMMQETAGR